MLQYFTFVRCQESILRENDPLPLSRENDFNFVLLVAFPQKVKTGLIFLSVYPVIRMSLKVPIANLSCFASYLLSRKQKVSYNYLCFSLKC